MDKSKVSHWSHKLWGVLVSPVITGEKWLMIGAAWHGPREKHYEGEPNRPLTFNTRAEAKAWVAGKKGFYSGRFKVVRVRQTVEVSK